MARETWVALPSGSRRFCLSYCLSLSVLEYLRAYAVRFRPSSLMKPAGSGFQLALFWSTNSQLVASLDVRHVVLLCVNKAKNPPGQQGVKHEDTVSRSRVARLITRAGSSRVMCGSPNCWWTKSFDLSQEMITWVIALSMAAVEPSLKESPVTSRDLRRIL
jgi:hypothetical protein